MTPLQELLKKREQCIEKIEEHQTQYKMLIANITREDQYKLVMALFDRILQERKELHNLEQQINQLGECYEN